MTMKLYYNPQSRAAIAKWMLDEAGADYEIVPISFEKREQKAPEFLKINPAGKLPAPAPTCSRTRPSASTLLRSIRERGWRRPSARPIAAATCR